MRLGARWLTDVQNVNSWEVTTRPEMAEGDTARFYLQLIDLSVDLPSQGYNPGGRRYVPDEGATLQVTILNVDDAKKLVKTGSQPFPNDPSIWQFDVLAADPVRGTPSISLKLTEGASVHNAHLQGQLRVSGMGPV